MNQKQTDKPKRKLPPPGPKMTFEQAGKFVNKSYGKSLAKLADRDFCRAPEAREQK